MLEKASRWPHGFLRVSSPSLKAAPYTQHNTTIASAISKKLAATGSLAGRGPSRFL